MRIIYIDDDDKELEKYKRTFEEDERAKNRFEIVTINSQKKIGDLISEVEKNNPDLILVDFELDIPSPKDDMVIGISGAPLSTALREKFPDIPIVLFTRPDVFKIELYSPKVLSSLDDIIYKSDFNKDVELYLDSFYELANGFEKLRNAESKNWADLLRLIKAPESDYNSLKLSNPPIASGGVWSVSEAADWIRNTLIKYPGILYDPIHAATFLGISLEEFLSGPIQEFFTKAKYSGVFTPPEGRWWKSKLQEIAESIMDEKEIDLLTYEGFPLAWERTGVKIERSKCVFSGESPAEWVCYILKKPVKIKYSLSYRPDSRPAVMDEARVSFEAIRTSNDVNDDLFEPVGQEMLPEIRKMLKSRGGDNKDEKYRDEN